MNIIIAGGGIGGLSAALALRRYGHTVQVYERVSEIRPVGAAISIWPNGVKCLNELGLAEQTRAIGGRMQSMAYIDGMTGDIMTSFDLQPLIDAAGERPYPVARAELQAMLMDAVGADSIHLDHALTAIHQSDDQIMATFANGHQVTADLLIGADGTHSVARQYVLGEATPRRYAGYVNWNGLIEQDAALAPADQWTTYVGEGKRVSLMPVAGGRFYFFLDVPMPAGVTVTAGQTRTMLQQQFGHWCQPVRDLIARLDPTRTNRVEIHDIEPFDQWVRGRCVLLGDAAHSTTPDIGQGGCQALEDAIYLARSLTINKLSLTDSLQRYQQRRASRANQLVLRARKRAAVTHAADPAMTAAWYDELRHETGEHIMAGILANITGNPLD